jgi:general transcription factor 3C protein 4
MVPQTPVPGINTDTTAAVKTYPTKGNTVSKPLAWLRTFIEQDKRALYYHWPTDSQGTHVRHCRRRAWPAVDTSLPEWGAISLGSLDLSLRAVTSTPCILSSEKG